MTVTFVAIPGPFIAWYHLPNTKRYVHYTEGRGAAYSQTYHTTTYRVPYTFGTYFVDADYSNKNTYSSAYIRVERDPSCKDPGIPYYIKIHVYLLDNFIINLF